MAESNDALLEGNLQHYRQHHAGCSFAAFAAHKPEAHSWHLEVLHDLESLDEVVSRLRQNGNIATVSLLFPSVNRQEHLEQLIESLSRSDDFFRESLGLHKYYDIVGLRFRVDPKTVSWVTGLGPFDWMPATRQSPTTEIAFRIRGRPGYPWTFKEPPLGVVHLADMEFPGIDETRMRHLWDSSFDRTRRVLGHSPDMLSAAKTTFILPK
jgi:hypothetical protein